MISVIALLLQSAAAPASVPPWTVRAHPNADPTITSTMAGTASVDGNASLLFRCDASKVKVVSVQFFSRTPLGGPPNRQISVSVDNGAPVLANWEFVEKGAFVRDDVTVTTLTTAIAIGKSIKLHTTTATGDPIDATFSGPPSVGPVTGVLSACGYTLGTVPVRPKEKKGK